MKASRPLPSRSQRGVVLLFALIALVIMLIGAVAISRSMNSAQFTIGNIGFKRDLTNQGERVLAKVFDVVRSGGALAGTATNADLQAENYSSKLLDTDTHGIPLALLNDTTFTTNVGTAGKDITVDGQGVTLRYVLERMASATGPCSSTTCVFINHDVTAGSSSEWINSQESSGAVANSNPSAVPQQPVYRLTVRARGPRNTLAFYQTTFTAP